MENASQMANVLSVAALYMLRKASSAAVVIGILRAGKRVASGR